MNKTIYQLFLATVNQYPFRTALRYKKQGRYLAITYQELKNSVDAVAAELRQLGIQQKDKVGIFSYNRPEWVIADLAIMKLGAIVVSIYHNLPAFYAKYITNDSKMKLIFVENSELFATIESIRTETPSLKKVVLFDDSGVDPGKDFIKFSDMKKTELRTILEPVLISKDELATIVYTSGTTGEPKGVMLTHHNIVTNALSAIKRFRIVPEDIFLSFLPLCNMFEKTCGYYTILFAGGSIAYVENFNTIAEDVKKIRPTILITVPRIIEKVYDTVVKKTKESSFIKRVLLQSAINNLNEYANRQYKNLKIPLWLKIKYFLYNQFIAAKFRKLAGGRVRVIVSGSAPLNREVAKILHILGFNIMEGYGLTETAPIVCTNLLEDRRLGTVGKPIDDVEIKIGENDEILVKGPNLMKGYLNKPEETAKAIDQDGWFHTGDQGKFDEYGNLAITGRIKEIIVTSYGKKIGPVPIEQKISESEHVEQVMLYGDKMKHIVALIVPNRVSIERYARTKGISFDDYPALLATDLIKELFKHKIEVATSELASYEKPIAFALIAESFTVENGLLTPTLKLRRNQVIEKYKSLIESIYQTCEIAK